jgi:hypothetical protein
MQVFAGSKPSQARWKIAATGGQACAIFEK